MTYLAKAGNSVGSYETLGELNTALMAGLRHAAVEVHIPLGVRIDAETYRKNDHPAQIILSQGGNHIATLVRGKDIDVSCSPSGAQVPVQTFNIQFRDHKDPLTDRGLVWVRPAEFATAELILRPYLFGEHTDTVTAVVSAAEQAVQEKLLCHFDQAT
tara:strand:+ start:5061 stop:5534 length:474 start_codon:yes stop_codon:yes gene_type:complete